MAAENWFKVKPVGYGAWPANWKGWLALALFLGLCLAWIGAVSWARGAWFGGEPTAWDYLLMVGGVAPIYGAYTLLKVKKSDAPSRWRGGE